MKHVLFSVLFLTVVFLAGTMTPLVQRGMGHFAGNMATYSSGNTIAMVYNDNQTGDQSNLSSVVYRYSSDGGQSWNSSVVDVVWGNFCRPTISVNYDGYILVSYNIGVSRKLAKSTNGGQTWTVMSMGSSMEKSPYTEQRGNDYYSFEIDMPYPENAQHVFVSPINSETLFPPMYTTDKELSWNQTPVYYHGADKIYCSLRTNSDIWIKQTDVGTNGGWPTFYAPVITSGNVYSAQPNPPLSSIFLGGLVTNAPLMEFSNDHPDYGGGVTLGPLDYDPHNIVYVSVNNMTYEAWLGTISDPIPQTATVYNAYPTDPLGTPLYTNTYATRDTTWTLLTTGSAANANFFVNNKLWIKGNFYGNHTWSCSDTIMIVGNIHLAGTPAGQAPDNPTNLNTRDFVKLISAKNIVVKYGFTDPQTGARIHPNCRADNDPIRIYASLYTLTDDPDIRKDGCFTFEYQHPHSSTPSYSIFGNTFHDIDLHRYRYPQTTTQPWPAEVDLPWYNPLWPESAPYLERGVLQVWGNIMQRRRGYVHRNWNDMEHYNASGAWDPANDFCGGPSFYIGMTGYDPILDEYMTPSNYPGTVGSGIGYKKDYKGDRRIGIDERLWSFGLRLGSRFSSEGEFEPYYLKKYAKRIREKVYATQTGVRAYAVNNILVTETQDLQFDLSQYLGNDGNIVDMCFGDGELWVMQVAPNGNQYRMKLRSLIYHDGEILQDLPYLYVNTMLNAITWMPNGATILARVLYNNGYYIDISRVTSTGELVSIGQYSDPLLQPSDLFNRSRLYIRPASANELDVFLYLEASGGDPHNPHGLIYHARASLSGLDSDDPASPAQSEAYLEAYPNPMSRDLQLEMKLSPNRDYHLELYNLRGQLIRTWEGRSPHSGDLSALWDGRDAKGELCGSGLYYFVLKAEGLKPLKKVICKI